MRRILIFLSLVCAQWSHGASTYTNQASQQNGLNFVQSIAPTTTGQIVNPNNVNSQAWAGQSSVPTSTPTNLGSWSAAPNTTIYGNAQAIGLSGLGQQAEVNCANYTPGTNPLQDQACAAINFLQSKCIQPTTQEAKILQNTGTSVAQSAACQGTYGYGAAQFNFQNTMSSSNVMFNTITGLKQNTTSASGACGVQSTVTTPATYQLESCVTSNSTTSNSCSEYLNAKVITTTSQATVSTSCPSGVLVGSYCQSTSSSAATQSYSCPAGFALSGTTCSQTLTQAATTTYSCPTGYNLSGNTCTKNTIITTKYCKIYGSWSMPGETPSTPLKISCNGNTGFLVTEYSVGHPSQLISLTIGTASHGQASAMEIWNRLYGPRIGKIIDYQWDGQGTLTLSSPPCYPTTNSPASSLISALCSPRGIPVQQFTIPVTQVVTTQTVSSVPIPSISCPSGYVYNGTTCAQSNSQAAASNYICPSGSSLSGNQCVTTSNVTPNTTYSCPGGSAPQNGICITNTVQTNWIDSCTPYESSAGIFLNPQ